MRKAVNIGFSHHSDLSRHNREKEGNPRSKDTVDCSKELCTDLSQHLDAPYYLSDYVLASGPL